MHSHQSKWATILGCLGQIVMFVYSFQNKITRLPEGLQGKKLQYTVYYEKEKLRQLLITVEAMMNNFIVLFMMWNNNLKCVILNTEQQVKDGGESSIILVVMLNLWLRFSSHSILDYVLYLKLPTAPFLCSHWAKTLQEGAGRLWKVK